MTFFDDNSALKLEMQNLIPALITAINIVLIVFFLINNESNGT